MILKKHIITCGVYLYDPTTNKLLICHPTDASWRTWSIPKGLKDGNENDLEAALRELEEETGITKKELKMDSVIAFPPVKYKKQDKFLHAFFVMTEGSLSNRKLICSSLTNAGKPEIDKWAWVEPDQLLIRVHESQQQHYAALVELLKRV
ncbi:MAG TPA: NUDIX domain-containing protein [Bacteroidia bacterium]|jgi:8-oxo-dGTP pyrophosphatase MutT (NUDIX family)